MKRTRISVALAILALLVLGLLVHQIHHSTSVARVNTNLDVRPSIDALDLTSIGSFSATNHGPKGNEFAVMRYEFTGNAVASERSAQRKLIKAGYSPNCGLSNSCTWVKSDNKYETAIQTLRVNDNTMVLVATMNAVIDPGQDAKSLDPIRAQVAPLLSAAETYTHPAQYGSLTAVVADDVASWQRFDMIPLEDAEKSRQAIVQGLTTELAAKGQCAAGPGLVTFLCEYRYAVDNIFVTATFYTLPQVDGAPRVRLILRPQPLNSVAGDPLGQSQQPSPARQPSSASKR